MARPPSVRQFLRHGEKVIIVITINPGAALGSPCKLQVQWSLNKRRWRTVAGGSFMAIDLHASSQWAKFKAPTVLR